MWSPGGLLRPGGCHQFTYRLLTLGQFFEYGNPQRVGQRLEDVGFSFGRLGLPYVYMFLFRHVFSPFRFIRRMTEFITILLSGKVVGEGSR